MKSLVNESVEVHGTPAEVWAVILDPAALARVLPGAEALESTGPDTFRGVLAAKIQFMTVRADVQARFEDADAPRHLRLVIDGRPRGLAGSFHASIPFDLEAIADGEGHRVEMITRVGYTVELTVSGRLAVFGEPLMRDTMRRQVAALVDNLDRELAERRSSPTGLGA